MYVAKGGSFVLMGIFDWLFRRGAKETGEEVVEEVVEDVVEEAIERLGREATDEFGELIAEAKRRAADDVFCAGPNDCDALASKIVDILGERGVTAEKLRYSGRTEGLLPNPALSPDDVWSHHSIVQLPGGKILDPKLNRVFESLDEFRRGALLNPEDMVPF